MERHNVLEYRGPGIYEIVDVDNGCVYIGSSNNIRKRIQEHFSTMRNGVGRNVGLQKAYDAGHSFTVRVVKKIHCSFQKELQSQESDEIDKRLANGEHLYNDTDIRGGYRLEDSLINELAKRYAMEHFGLPLYRMVRNKATAEMWMEILERPDEEAEIKAQYEEAISYQSLVAYYRGRKIDYDEMIEKTP